MKRRTFLQAGLTLGLADATGMGALARGADSLEAEVEKGLIIDGRRASITERMAQYKVPGVSVAVLHNGLFKWARGYGVAAAGGSSSVNEDTLFQAASISKSVTAQRTESMLTSRTRGIRARSRAEQAGCAGLLARRSQRGISLLHDRSTRFRQRRGDHDQWRSRRSALWRDAPGCLAGLLLAIQSLLSEERGDSQERSCCKRRGTNQSHSAHGATRWPYRRCILGIGQAITIWWACRVDPADRYRRLAEFAEKYRLEREAEFWRTSERRVTENGPA